MNKNQFPTVAIVLCVVFAAVVTFGERQTSSGDTTLPLLMLLGICELGFFVGAIGAYLGFQQIRVDGTSVQRMIIAVLCVLSAAYLSLRGISLWPG